MWIEPVQTSYINTFDSYIWILKKIAFKELNKTYGILSVF